MGAFRLRQPRGGAVQGRHVRLAQGSGPVRVAEYRPEAGRAVGFPQAGDQRENDGHAGRLGLKINIS